MDETGGALAFANQLQWQTEQQQHDRQQPSKQQQQPMLASWEHMESSFWQQLPASHDANPPDAASLRAMENLAMITSSSGRDGDGDEEDGPAPEFRRSHTMSTLRSKQEGDIMASALELLSRDDWSHFLDGVKTKKGPGIRTRQGSRVDCLGPLSAIEGHFNSSESDLYPARYDAEAAQATAKGQEALQGRKARAAGKSYGGSGGSEFEVVQAAPDETDLPNARGRQGLLKLYQKLKGLSPASREGSAGRGAELRGSREEFVAPPAGRPAAAVGAAAGAPHLHRSRSLALDFVSPVAAATAAAAQDDSQVWGNRFGSAIHGAAGGNRKAGGGGGGRQFLTNGGAEFFNEDAESWKGHSDDDEGSRFEGYWDVLYDGSTGGGIWQQIDASQLEDAADGLGVAAMHPGILSVPVLKRRQTDFTARFQEEEDDHDGAAEEYATALKRAMDDSDASRIFEGKKFQIGLQAEGRPRFLEHDGSEALSGRLGFLRFYQKLKSFGTAPPRNDGKAPPALLPDDFAPQNIQGHPFELSKSHTLAVNERIRRFRKDSAAPAVAAKRRPAAEKPKGEKARGQQPLLDLSVVKDAGAWNADSEEEKEENIWEVAEEVWPATPAAPKTPGESGERNGLSAIPTLVRRKTDAGRGRRLGSQGVEDDLRLEARRVKDDASVNLMSARKEVDPVDEWLARFNTTSLAHVDDVDPSFGRSRTMNARDGCESIGLGISSRSKTIGGRWNGVRVAAKAASDEVKCSAASLDLSKWHHEVKNEHIGPLLEGPSLACKVRYYNFTKHRENVAHAEALQREELDQ